MYVYNTIQNLAEFFGTPDNPVKLQEFVRFWESLTDAERHYYRHTRLY